MASRLKSDRVLFMAALVLVGASVVMVYSASAVIAAKEFDDGYHYVTRQALWVVLGVSVLAIAMHIDYRTYRSDPFVWTVIGIVTVLLIAVFFARPVNGAHRWLMIAGFGIQPAELAKFACVLFTALVLERRMHRINEVRYSLLPIGIVAGGLAALILNQPDYGTTVSLLLVVGVMVFAAGLQYRYLIAGTALLAAVMVRELMREEYRWRRVISFLDPWADRFGDGWQVVQSHIAVGTGGVFGRGLMTPGQKLFFLPEPHTDFIFSVIAEELGLIGASAVLLCFCVIAWRGLRIALRAEDSFGAFVALGLTTMICAQALINMSVALGLLPPKGIPLPLLSAGGSSMLVSLLGIGVLLNISQHETETAT
jgi:cell division protein FtsW